MGIKYPVDVTFFETWNPAMAYFLGYLFADGSMEDSTKIRGHYVRATSTDLSLLENLRTHLRSGHTIVAIRRHSPSEKQQWLLRIGSHGLYDSLLSKGVHPQKSLTMQLPDIPTQFLGAFTRGYLDGDGCVFVERQKTATGKIITKRLRTIFTSGSKQFLTTLHDKLSLISPRLNSGHLYTSNTVHRLIYPTEASVVLFSLMYRNAEPTQVLLRKLEKYIEYFRLQPSRIDSDVSSIIEKLAQW